jgi:sugar/nucleoside kinase (ribokinase family)
VETGITVSVDPSSAALLSPEFLDWAGGAGLLLPNADESRMLSGERDPERAGKTLASRFSEVVVTMGADGALWTDGRATVRADAIAVEDAVDSTGAGDAFAAGLLAARLGGADPAAALAAGARLAAEAVTRPGGRP